MTTFATLKTRLILQTGLSDPLIGQLLVESYKTFQETYPYWSFLRKTTTLTTVAPYSTGTVATGASSDTITGTGTTFTSAMVGRYIKVNNDFQFYKIATYTNPTTIAIETDYADGAKTAQTYSIFKHIFSLASDFREMISPVFETKLIEATIEDIDRYDPGRDTSDRSRYFIYLGLDSSAIQELELYPVPSAAHMYRYRYWAKPFTFSAGADINYLPDTLLINDTLATAYLHLAREDIKNTALYIKLSEQYRTQAVYLFNEAKHRDVTILGQSKRVRDYESDQRLVGSDWELSHQIS